MRNLQLRGLLTAEEAAEANLALERLVIERLVIVRDIRLRLLMPESRRLIDHFAEPVSQGGMDVLHVAAARVFRMKTLLSFDENQCALALSAAFFKRVKFVARMEFRTVCNGWEDGRGLDAKSIRNATRLI